MRLAPGERKLATRKSAITRLLSNSCFHYSLGPVRLFFLLASFLAHDYYIEAVYSCLLVPDLAFRRIRPDLYASQGSTSSFYVIHLGPTRPPSSIPLMHDHEAVRASLGLSSHLFLTRKLYWSSIFVVDRHYGTVWSSVVGRRDRQYAILIVNHSSSW